MYKITSTGVCLFCILEKQVNRKRWKWERQRFFRKRCTWPDAHDSLSLKLTLNSDGTNNTERTYDNTISNETLMNLLQMYTPLKLINPDYVTSYVTTNGVIDQTDGIPENLKQYILKNIAINVGVPTVSTWNGLPNKQ